MIKGEWEKSRLQMEEEEKKKEEQKLEKKKKDSREKREGRKDDRIDRLREEIEKDKKRNNIISGIAEELAFYREKI